MPAVPGLAACGRRAEYCGCQTGRRNRRISDTGRSVSCGRRARCGFPGEFTPSFKPHCCVSDVRNTAPSDGRSVSRLKHGDSGTGWLLPGVEIKSARRGAVSILLSSRCGSPFCSRKSSFSFSDLRKNLVWFGVPEKCSGTLFFVLRDVLHSHSRPAFMAGFPRAAQNTSA